MRSLEESSRQINAGRQLLPERPARAAARQQELCSAMTELDHVHPARWALTTDWSSRSLSLESEMFGVRVPETFGIGSARQRSAAGLAF